MPVLAGLRPFRHTRSSGITADRAAEPATARTPHASGGRPGVPESVLHSDDHVATLDDDAPVDFGRVNFGRVNFGRSAEFVRAVRQVGTK